MAGLTQIPAYIIVAEDTAMLEMAIVENIQRENLNPVEVALGYKQLIENHELTQEMLSEKLGKSRPSIANHLRLLKLPGEIQIGLRQELITIGHAKVLLGIQDTKPRLNYTRISLPRIFRSGKLKRSSKISWSKKMLNR